MTDTCLLDLFKFSQNRLAEKSDGKLDDLFNGEFIL